MKKPISMRNVIGVALAAVMVLTLGATAFASVDETGNGAPSGPHYNLNIIGVPKEKTADMTGDNGHRIFVKLDGKTKINLIEDVTEPYDFAVLDANGTDGTAAFQLPAADSDNTGITAYSVWARPVGKPGGSANMTTCGIDPVTLETVCSVLSYLPIREKGKPSFTDVSKYLLYVYADIDADTVAERIPIFDDALQDYFWSYDNSGLKVLQLRFYPITSNDIPVSVP